MFENPDFEVDKSTEEYRLLKPLLTQLDKNKMKKLEKRINETNEDNAEAKEGSSDDDLFSEKDESSDDDNKWTQEVRFAR